ncbi:MAG: hypothetical protein NW226_05390 [Microscillaceae bacterium]|nr:hypothetical protein [Microscillaceae bacterium]
MKKYSDPIPQYLGVHNTFLQLVAGVFLLFLVSCGGGGGISSQHVQVPKDVAFVVSMDFNKLTSKAQNWQDVLDQDLLDNFQINAREAQAVLKKILQAGIDYQQKAYLFGSLSKEENDDILGFSFLLSDPGKFEKAMTESKKKPEIKKLGELKYIIGNENIIGWKGKTALFLGLEQDMPEAQLLEKFNKIFNTEAANSLSTSSREFTQIDGAGYDFAFWVDQQKINALNPEMEYLEEESPVFSQLSKMNLFTTGGLSFEKGNMSIQISSHLDKNLSQQYETLLKNGINDKTIKNIPIDTPSLMLGFSLNMKTLYDLFKNESYIREGDEEFNKEFGLSMREVFEIFDGDCLLITQDIKTQTLIQNPEPEFVLSLGIANKKNLDKILSEYVKQNNLDQRPDFYIMKGLPNPIYLFENNKTLYMTMSEKYKNDILKDKGSMGSKFAQIASDKSVLLFLNIKDLMKQIPSALTEGSSELVFFREAIAPQLEDVVMDSSPVKNHIANSKVVFNFVDKNQNALMILANIFKKMSKENKELSLK